MVDSELDFERPFICELPNVLTPEECDDWIARIKAAGTEYATINTPRGQRVESQIRNNRRVIIEDKDWADVSNALRTMSPRIFGSQLVAVNERLRCYEYSKSW